jgi:Uma2 family endonuclease
MSLAPAQPESWTVEGLYALPDDGLRHELLDGTLLLSPPPSVPHQLAARRLVAMLAAGAPQDVEVLEAVGVTLPAGLLVPDVVVARADVVHAAARHLEAADVLAVAEIVSPSSRTNDRRWKPEVYAEAGIPIYLRVELETADGSPEIVASELTENGYRVTTIVRGQEQGTLAPPFRVSLRPAALRGPLG